MDPLTIGLLGSAAVGMIGGAWANRANAREARRNREFQERMSSTAHQREVADLRKAGINTALRAMGGSSTPGGDRAEMRDPTDGGRGVSSAVMARAQIKLIEAQTGREDQSARLLQQQRFDLEGNPQGGAGRRALALADIAEMDVQQLRAIMPDVLAKAKEEVQLTASGARAARARAALDEAAREGALNQEDFERMIGTAGPWVRALGHILRSVRR